MRGLFADTRPLQSPHFRRLWVANIITIIGAQLTVIAVPAQIFSMTGSSAMVGLAGLFGLVPLIVFGLWGGSLADYVERRRLLEITTLGLIGTAALLWLQAWMDIGNVWVLLSIYALQQMFFALNQPVRQAILPEIIPASQIPAASALNMTVVSGGAIVGPLIGGALIPVLGYSALYFVDTLTLFATLYAVYKLPQLPASAKEDGSTPGFRSVVDGLKYLRFHHIVMVSFIVDLIAMVFGMPRALYPEVAHVQFGGPVEGGTEFALLMAAMPLGIMLGGIFGGWISKVERYGLAVIIAISIWGASVVGLGIAFQYAPAFAGPMLILACVMLAVGGAADMASAAFRQGILLGETTEAMRGRLQGVFLVVVIGGPRIADVLHGSVAEKLGPSATTWGGGLLVLLGMAICVFVFPKFVAFKATNQGE